MIEHEITTSFMYIDMYIIFAITLNIGNLFIQIFTKPIHVSYMATIRTIILFFISSICSVITFKMRPLSTYNITEYCMALSLGRTPVSSPLAFFDSTVVLKKTVNTSEVLYQYHQEPYEYLSSFLITLR